jgi:PKD repeat protein
VNNVNACGNGSASGQWLPGIDVGQALRAGTLLQLAASADAATGYRSNLDFMNPGAAAATVAVTVRRGDGTPLAGGTISVGPNGLVQKAIDDGSAFPGVAGTTDTNLWVDFTSDVPVLVFASVINNGSGDPFAIVMTAEPAARAAAPVASYSVSASPATGQPATFTDTSSNAPVNRFWSFGDGIFDASGGSVVTHAYGSPGTYRTALFVDNAGGSSSAVKDVVVSSAAPIPVGISATTTGGTHWTFTPNNVNLKVGQAYVITWTTPPAEATVHGMGGLDVLGIAPCSVITAALPCVRTFTPGAGQVGLWSYACTNNACGTVTQHNGMTGTVTIAP